MKKGLFIFVLAGLMLMSLLIAPIVGAKPHHTEFGKELTEIRQATVKYRDINKALEDGYVFPDYCVDQMGYHLVNNDLAENGEIDMLQPEILIYEPMKNGKYRLVAVEWLAPHAVFDETPALFGRTFDKGVPYPDVDTLHAWIWQANPNGMFSGSNPNISCQYE
ncbi:hypothetical protein QA612_06440 [Evansella sp. AB-P1]|uniref:hypothetical protein n=1 Tax=Evansella sp. AB-P1 TaxID=3037653 RepID=UPI00241CCC4E|nr:hypothetical protein [Evansella sp. AB-P1]MDG5787125.1 hypothetical protein [Evansella sp. AB-P1]